MMSEYMKYKEFFSQLLHLSHCSFILFSSYEALKLYYVFEQKIYPEFFSNFC